MSETYERVNIKDSPIYKTILFISKQTLTKWLKEFKPDEDIKEIIKVVYETDDYIIRNGISKGFIRSPLNRGVKFVANAIAKSGGFGLKKRNPALYNKYNMIAPLLTDYLEFLQAILNTDEIVVSSKEKLEPYRKLFKINDSAYLYSPLEPELFVLLQKAKYTALRNVLIKQNINTLASFKNLDLWDCLTGHQLCSLEQCKAICEELGFDVPNEAIQNPGWYLETNKCQYTGATPAQVLVKYCSAMAAKHLIRFQELIGKRYNSNGEIIFMRIRLHPNDAKIEKPETYVRYNISAENALNYAKWVWQACKDAEEPILIQPLYKKTVDNGKDISEIEERIAQNNDLMERMRSRNVIVNDDTLKLISDIEFIIGNCCYNGDSYNGWTNEYGCSFRYPLSYGVREGRVIQIYKTRSTINNEPITEENIKSVAYRFGSNQLEIGSAIIGVLNMLEKRYSIDINALEEKYQRTTGKDTTYDCVEYEINGIHCQTAAPRIKE